MVLSMTGSGSANRQFKSARGTLDITIDIKTVNSRYLDLSIRSPRIFSSLDSQVGSIVRSQLKRGRVDVNISVISTEASPSRIRIQDAYVGDLYRALSELKSRLGVTAPLTLSDLIRASNDWLVIEDSAVRLDEEWDYIHEVLKDALEQVVGSRKREGSALDLVLRQHLKDFDDRFKKVSEAKDQLITAYRERFQQKIKDLMGSTNIDPQRLEQEIVFWIARSDFQEEIDRIRHHLTQLSRILSEPSEVGKKFEFIIQELHREVNTMGSKCPDAQVLPLIVDMKTAIERMREQIQNIE